MLDFVGIGCILSLLYVLINHENRTEAGALLMGGVLLISLKNVFSVWINNYCSGWFLSIYCLFSRNLLSNYYNRGLLYIKEKGCTVLTHEINSVCYTFAMNVLSSFYQIIGKGTLVFLLSIAFFIYSPLLALIFLPSVILIICLYIRLVRKRVVSYGKEEEHSKKKQWKNVRELFNGYVEIETNQAFKLLNNRFEQTMGSITSCRKKAKQIQLIPSVLLETVMTLVLFVLFFIAKNSNELILLLGVFAIVGMRIIPSIQTIVFSWTQIHNYAYTIDIVAQAISTPPVTTVTEQNSIKLKFEDTLAAEGISFVYEQNHSLVLDNFTIKIGCGEFVGIQGLSGVGKTTLINLLSGFIQPCKGQILIDGVPLSDSNVKEWQRMVGYVPQDIFIIDGTIAENVALGVKKENIDNERVGSILQQVCLDLWVSTLPFGIETSLGEDGSLISGGQKQRIGIARALYKKARVFFFDEATSALDSKTEEEILQVICKLPEIESKITIIMIAHRQSSLSKCHRIMKL